MNEGHFKRLVVFGAKYFDLIKLIDAINRTDPTWLLLGFLDDLKELQDKTFFGFRVLGGREIIGDLLKEGDTSFFNNVSTWPKSERVVDLLSSYGCTFTNLIHPSIDMSYVDIGCGCILPEGCVVGGNVVIGNFVTVRLMSLISHDVEVEDFVFIGPGVTIGGHAKLKKGCFIGAGATVMGEVTVGKGSIIGAGAVVIKDVADGVTAVGVPAKAIERHATNQ